MQIIQCLMCQHLLFNKNLEKHVF